MRELFGVLNLLDPEEWDDEEDFYDKYGGDAEPPTVEQIQALQVRPHLGFWGGLLWSSLALELFSGADQVVRRLICGPSCCGA